MDGWMHVHVIACGESTSVGWLYNPIPPWSTSFTRAYSTPFNAMPCPHFARHGDTLSPLALPSPLTPLALHRLHRPRHISPFLFHFRLQTDRVCSVLFLEAMLHHAMLYHAVPCRAVPCHHMLRYAALCYAMLCCVAPCRAIHCNGISRPSACLPCNLASPASPRERGLFDVYF
jgi:hypothetical protein